MQISRLFQILYILLEKGTVTANQLAERFEVSVRTIYRDVEALSQAGIPIYASQGKGGGISLSDRFVLNKSLLSELEQEEILLGLQSMSVVSYPEFDDVLSKLSSLFMKSNINWIEVDFSTWGDEEEQKEIFSLLKNAILQQKIIAFSYFGVSGDKSDRIAVPMKLLFKDKAWYLKGYCLDRKALRTFKITRMSNVHVTGNYPDYHILQHKLSVPADKPSAALKVQLKLKISAAGAYRVYDDFGKNEITKDQDGSYIVTTSLPAGEWILDFLFSFGPLLEVIEPPDIRMKMVSGIQKMAEKYSI